MKKLTKMHIPKIYASQNFLRYSFIAANSVVFVLCMVMSALGYSKIPNYPWGDYVFWLYKPLILILLILTVVVVPMGYTGAIKFNKCWQSSYSFFVFALLVFSILAYLAAKDIKNESETIIPKLYMTGLYYSQIYELAAKYDAVVSPESPYVYMNYLVWQDDYEYNIKGLHSYITEELGNFPEKAKKYTLATLIIYIIFFVYNLFISVFVAEPDSVDGE